MMALVTKTIKTAGGDYSTTQLWFDATPADFDVDGNAQRGELFRGVNGSLTLSSRTTSATNYLELTAGAGESFQDDLALKQSGLLDVNLTNYAGFSTATNYSANISGGSGSQVIDYFRISRLQFLTTTNNSSSIGTWIGDNHWTVENNIFKTAGPGSRFYGNNTRVQNNIFINTNSSGVGTPGIYLQDFVHAHANTFFRVSNQSAGGVGIQVSSYSTGSFTSNAIFGYTTPSALGGTGSSYGTTSNNVTDAASGLPGSNNVHGVTYTSTTPFSQSSSVSTLDCRTKWGTALDGAGLLDGTNAPNDIWGTARSATPVAGAMETEYYAAVPLLRPLSLRPRPFMPGIAR